MCTLASRLSTLTILRFVSSFVHLKGFEPITFRFVFGCSSVELKVHLVLLVGLEPTSLKGQQILSLSCITNSTTGAYCVYNGARTHDLWFHKPALCQLSYIHHIKTPSRRRGGSIYNVDLALVNFLANLLQTCAARSRHPFRPLGDGFVPRRITLDDSKLPVITFLIIPIRFWLVPYIGFEPIWNRI